MTGPEAAALDAFRREHPAWSVRPVETGDGFTAQRGGPPSLYGRTLAELHDAIIDAEDADLSDPADDFGGPSHDTRES